ncbi:transposase [Glutamicibacter creatinolyticus]
MLKARRPVKLPYWSYTANQAWEILAVLSVNFTSWIQLVMLTVRRPAGCWDVKRWRYRLYAVAGKLISNSRQTRLLILKMAPESALLMQMLEQAHTGYPEWRHGHLAHQRDERP